MIRAAILSLMLAATGSQALALSCVAPDPVASFAKAAAAPEPYIVVQGSFDFDAAALPGGSVVDQPEGTTIAAEFTGMGLTSEGFTTPLSIPVTLNVMCQVIWCGSLSADEPQLSFLERRDDGYHLILSPCPGQSFPRPDAAVLDRITACINGDC